MSLEVSGLVKSFGAREVLRGIDLRIEPGEIFAIAGPSGAGKTTLLRCVDFLLRPETGSIRYDGATTPAEPAPAIALRRRIGMVAQNPLLFRGNAAYNVSFGLCIRDVDEPELSRRTADALKALGMSDLAATRASVLSAGEAQRVAFARAVVVRPDLLLLDEFTANLDPTNVNILEGAVREYNRSTGATVILVTHNMFQAKRLANRVALLLEGRIVEVGAVPEFFENPKDPRTRAFVTGEYAY
ncbi:MAG: phosphate ABC transporter ATP-binding protein [Methanobacteriota archaeon]|nr:MAG: phosphate ABC transporter ATP-binding protein [Euryarchaeota archaeon]